MWTDVGEGVAAGSAEGFVSAVTIWINKPHVVNRRLCGSCSLYQTTLRTSVSPADSVTAIRVNATDLANPDSFENTLKRIFVPGSEVTGECSNHCYDIEIWIRDLHPKLLEKFCTQREIVLLDRERRVAVFVPVLLIGKDGETSRCLQDSYRLAYDDHRIRISVQKSEKVDLQTDPTSTTGSAQNPDSQGDLTVPMVAASAGGLTSGAICTEDWLREHLVHKVAQWSFHDNLNTDITSLKLVPLDQYNCRYNEMKKKYGPHLVENWPESTDPQKFVYEDISIAAYLLTLWEAERVERGLTEPQSFVDLGCGNGLLVHLLAEEGHPGKGIDLRKRNIWDGFYGPKTCLEEYTLTPSDKNLFEGYDWLIGNHSDELTPWIPVIAARSSYSCRYFVLPCCSYDFDSKFREKAQGRSQYRCYLDFVKLVGEVCGYHVEEDTLRIPSTKRVCFIGKSRTYESSEEASVDAQRADLIASRCSASRVPQSEQGDCDSAEGGAWAGNFKARSSDEKPRNCVSLDKALTGRVVTRVFEALLAADGAPTTVLSDGRQWNVGGRIPLSDVVSFFDPSIMKELKNECGGLQTLLRNHYHIFRVQAGCVQIRDMGPEDEQHWIRKKKQKGKQKSDQDMRKRRLCYLHENHPDGCPKSAESCRFAHGVEELKVTPTNNKSQ